MPELPEAETIARKLSEMISGKRIERVLVRRKDILKAGNVSDFEGLAGTKVLKVGRRAKCIILFFENDRQVWVHLGMTGQLIFGPVPSAAHIHAEFHFQGLPRALAFRDIRRFGGLAFRFSGFTPILLGPEPLEMTAEEFAGRLKGKKGRLKAVLMDQKFLAGIGNIYADEILFRAKIHPAKTPARLSPEKILNLFQAARKVLSEAIEAGGSSINDYVHPDGSRGKFQEMHRIYAKHGKPCRDCGAKIRRIVLNGRSTCFCPDCQKK